MNININIKIINRTKICIIKSFGLPGQTNLEGCEDKNDCIGGMF